jgi:hypothetical protein
MSAQDNLAVARANLATAPWLSVSFGGSGSSGACAAGQVDVYWWPISGRPLPW